MMQTDHSKQELKLNSSWRDLELLLLFSLDNELRCSIDSLLRWVNPDNESDKMKAIIVCKVNNHTSMNNDKQYRARHKQS